MLIQPPLSSGWMGTICGGNEEGGDGSVVPTANIEYIKLREGFVPETANIENNRTERRHHSDPETSQSSKVLKCQSQNYFRRKWYHKEQRLGCSLFGFNFLSEESHSQALIQATTITLWVISLQPSLPTQTSTWLAGISKSKLAPKSTASKKETN